MAQSLLELIFRTSKSGQGGKQAAAELREVKSTVGELSQGLTGMNLASFTGIGAITALGAAAVSTAKEWSGYAETIGRISDVSGVGAEEISRLYQAADDARIPVEALEKAFALALKNGFQPSIEHLATLADRIKGMDPLERAATMTKIFGKSWETIYPLLKDGGQTLKDNTAAIQDGLVVTDELVQKNRELLKAQDDMNDALTAARYEAVLPLIEAYTLWIKTNLDAKPAIDQTAYALKVQQQITNEAGLELLKFNSSMDVGASNRNDFIESFGKMSEAESGFTSSSMSAASAVRDNLSQAIREQGTIQAQLADATKQLEADQKSFGQSLAGDVASALDAAGLKSQDLKGALGAVDTQMGTNYETTQEQKEAVKALVDQYARDKDVGAFSKGLEDINNKFMPLNESVKESEKRVVDLNTQLALAAIWVDKLNGSKIFIETKYTTTGTPPNPNPKNPKSTTPWEGQSGLDAVVPPGFPNDTFPVMASSGERVIILPQAQTQGAVGGYGLRIDQVVIANGMDLEEFKMMLKLALPAVWK